MSNNSEVISCFPFIKENAYYSYSPNYILDKNVLFVFGSNLAGRHGKGGALEARLKYGAMTGLGSGIVGEQCFAIPTKDHNLQVLPLSEIKKYIDEFILATKILKDKSFYVTPIGTGLSRYRHEDIAPMFSGCLRCWLPEEWEKYLH